MTTHPPIRILFVEDVPADAELAARVMRKEGLSFTSRHVETEEEFVTALDEFQPDVIISDYAMPQFDGMRALQISLERNPALPFIVLTGTLNEETAVNCIKAGATDYVIKERITRLPFAVQEALTQHQALQAKEAAEQALRASEAQYRLLAENMSDTVWLMDMNLRTLYISPSVIRTRGYTLDEVNALPLDQQLTPESLPRAMEVLAEALSPENLERSDPRVTYSVELEFYRKDGTKFWSENTFTLILDQDKQPINILGTGREITERKQAEQKLRESEARFSTIFRASPVSIAITRLSDSQLIDVNEAYLNLTGYAYAEIIGHTPRELNLWADPGQRDELIKALREQGTAREVEVQIRQKSGDFRAVLMSAELIDLAGERYMLTLAQDITERKQAEQAMRQRLAELEALHAASAALRTAQTLDQALPKLLDESLAALETDAGAIWLFQPESNALLSAIARGWVRQLEGEAYLPTQGIVGRVFSSGKPYHSADFAADPLCDQSKRHLIPSRWGGACVPIRAATETVGVLLASVPLPREITPQQMKLLTSLTEIAGATLHRMRLHEETVRRLERIQALRAVDQAIAASLDLRITLDILLDQTIAQLGVDAAAVLLLDPYQHTLKYAAGRGFRTRAIEASNIRLGENFAGHIALERRVVQVSDVETLNQETRFAKLWNSEGFRAYRGVPLIAKGQVNGVLEVFHRTDFTPNSEWGEFLETLAGQAAITIDNTQLFEGLQRANMELAVAYDDTIEGWSRALDLRDRETEGHTQRVTEITLALAGAMGMTDQALHHLRRGALLHDIGKMGVPDAILFKPDELTDEEWTIMRQHPQLAWEMLQPITYLRQSLDIPYCHHEKWDGTGYPRGLHGEQIPLAARLFAIVDVWDALTSDRPYRKAWTKEQALAYVREQSGKHFDPQVVEVFIQKAESERL